MAIIAIDFEIANSKYSSACSIGLVVIEGLNIIDEKYFLIQPPGNEVDSEYTKIHGLTADDLKDAPTFDLLWENISTYFTEDNMFVAHNAYFDMNVLVNCLKYYKINTPTFQYFDSIAYSTKVCQGNGIGTSLEDRTNHLGIDIMNAHNALDDARAAAELVIACTKIKNQLSISSYLDSYDISIKDIHDIKVTKTFRHNSSKKYRSHTEPAEIHKAVNSLIGILKGVQFDEVINIFEVEEIINWCNLHRKFGDKAPFSEIIPLIDKAMEDEVFTVEEITDILWLCESIVHHDGFDSYYNLVTSAIQQLHGIIHGIMADNVLLDYEINKLHEWMDDNDHLKGCYPFDEIYSLVTEARKDGVLTDDEKNMLKAYFGNFIDTTVSYNINESELQELQKQYTISGICTVNPKIEFAGKAFCFTGASDKADRKEIAATVTELGAVFSNNVTKSTDYLIVGNAGNPCWAFSCYGRKVEKAVELRKKGNYIVIVNEDDFWNKV